MRFRRRTTPAPELTPEQRQRVTRRRFLKAGGVLGAGLIVVCVGGNLGLNYVRSNTDSFVPKMTDDPNAWLRIGPDGRVRLFVNKMEMGQGIATAAAQIVAEELALPFEQIEYVAGTTDEMPEDSFGTSGSMSVIGLYPALKAAGAEARYALRTLAAERSGLPVAQLVARDGRITAQRDPAVSFSYGELIGDRQIVRVVRDERAAIDTTAREQYRVIGQPVKRLDIPAKVDGSAKYGYDIQIEGMLHGRVAHPPVIGATIESVDLAAARAMPGVVAAVHDGDFVGVAAETPQQAAQALSAIAIRWKQPARLIQQADVEALLTEANPTVLTQSGDVTRGLAQGTRISAEYRTGFATQSPIEPQAAVADVRADRATVWAPTQAPFSLRGQIAEIAGLDEAQVTIAPTLLGGGFGRKVVSDAAYEATRLSKAAGRPVRVGWSRGEEFAYGFMRPPTISRFEGAIDGQGMISGWRQHLASGFVLFAFFPTFLRFIFGSDFGATRGAVGPYTLANQHVSASIHELPVKTGSWRGLGMGPNAFAVEQFMDELAAAANVDPLEFRLRHLDGGAAGVRMRRVLETAARRSGWGAALPEGHGRGIACGVDGGTYVAEVAEVAVDRSTGAVRVMRVTAAIDCGLVINPDIVTAQTEGAIMMGLSAALREEITLRDGAWSAGTFYDYPIFTIADAPEIDVVLIDNRATDPGGIGEPPLLPAAAAVGNAIFAATGARVRSMPMTPERVLAALGTA